MRAPSRPFRYVISPIKGVLKDLSDAVWLFLDLFSQYWIDTWQAGLDEPREWWKYPIWLSAHVVTHGYRQLSRVIELATKKPGLTVLEFYHVHNELNQALRVIKERAYNNTGVEIFSAMIIYPDFFNPSLRNCVRDSAHHAGIITHALDPLTMRQVFERYANILLFNKTQPVEQDGWDKEPTILLLDQGFSHFDLMTSGKHLMSHPIEPLACSRIWAGLRARLYERNADVLAEVTEADSGNRLGQEVMAAREALKMYRECERQGFGAGEQLAEGIMLELGDWWTSEKRKQPVSLLWKDVEATDEEYVEKMAECVGEVQLHLQRATGSPNGLNAVVIMGAFCDGTLVTRAVKRSIGEDVPIFGSSTPEGQNMTYIAHFGARAALEVRQEVSRQLQAECGRKAEQFYQYQQELRRRRREDWHRHSDAGYVRYRRDEL